MEIQGEKILTVSREEVWRALNNPAVLQRSLPGCDTFEADGDNRYKVALQASVGPVRARFSGKLVLSDIVAPTSYALSFEGSGGVAGFGKGSAQVVLDDVPGGTRLRYSAQALVGGRLAQVGARLIDGVTKRMADEFFSRFVKELQSGPESPVGSSTQRPGLQADNPITVDHMVALAAGVPALPLPEHPPQSPQIAVIAAAVSATAASVAVLAAVVVLFLGR
ncbi:SRPBCC family protein [Comamonas testosteroni]|uniref:SRPBCC family protein n=1 Tax=Comamonas testosteroni TaxID=285 RepID=UPI0009C1508A|nr:carbon monoxide dehydrogenase subunit G [Comamonas testosteroni]